jgi:hypothetical protein
VNKINNLLNQLEAKISNRENLKIEISKGNVAWHIEHSLLTINLIINALIQSNPKNYKWKFSFIRMVVLLMKKIPRGKVKSPKVVLPEENISNDSLVKHLLLTKDSIMKLESLSKDKYFTHPYFGDLKLNQTIVFLEIHTQHHLEIIEDIISNKQK